MLHVFRFPPLPPVAVAAAGFVDVACLAAALALLDEELEDLDEVEDGFGVGVGVGVGLGGGGGGGGGAGAPPRFHSP